MRILSVERTAPCKHTEVAEVQWTVMHNISLVYSTRKGCPRSFIIPSQFDTCTVLNIQRLLCHRIIKLDRTVIVFSNRGCSAFAVVNFFFIRSADIHSAVRRSTWCVDRTCDTTREGYRTCRLIPIYPFSTQIQRTCVIDIIEFSALCGVCTVAVIHNFGIRADSVVFKLDIFAISDYWNTTTVINRSTLWFSNVISKICVDNTCNYTYCTTVIHIINRTAITAACAAYCIVTCENRIFNSTGCSTFTPEHTTISICTASCIVTYEGRVFNCCYCTLFKYTAISISANWIWIIAYEIATNIINCCSNNTCCTTAILCYCTVLYKISNHSACSSSIHTLCTISSVALCNFNFVSLKFAVNIIKNTITCSWNHTPRISTASRFYNSIIRKSNIKRINSTCCMQK